MDWAEEFDERIKQYLLKDNNQGIVNFESLGKFAHLSNPTPEHFLPLIYIAALQGEEERITFPAEGLVCRSNSMGGVMIS
jgi:4,5-DOPA dioxygenase extradiol